MSSSAEPSTLERRAVALTRAVLAIGMLCGVLALDMRLASPGAHLVAAAALGALALLATRTARPPHPAAEILAWTAQAAAVALATLAADAPALGFLPTLLLWVALLAWRRLEHDAVAYAAGALTVGQALLLDELAGLPTEAPSLVVALPGPAEAVPAAALVLAVPLGVAAVVLVQARAGLRTRRRLSAAAGGPGATGDPEREARRLRAAFALGLAALVATLGLRTGADRIVTRLGPDPTPDGPAFDPLDAEPDFSARRERVARTFPNSVDYGGTLGDLGDDVIIEVAARRRLGEPGRIAPVLLLGALRLDRFTPEGVTLDAVTRPRTDAEDGTEDGWIEFAPGRPWALELDVTSIAITVGDSGRTPLFHPGRLVAVELDELFWHPRGVLTVEADPSGVQRYTVRAGSPADRAAALAGGRSGDPGGYALELPPASPELERLRTLAREVIGDAPHAGAAVERVLAHFADGYRYSFLGSERPGLEGLVDFVERREGFCSAYASTAALLLRLADVPARVVTGYRVTEYDPRRDRYVARARDAHAWFEVHFGGLGWVPFDATPAAALEAARSGEEPAPTSALPAWTVWVVAAGAALGATAWWSRRRGRRRREGERGAAGARMPEWFRELLAALERAGWGRRPSRTPREYAGDLERAEHPEAGAVREAVEVYYDERYADRPPTERERAGLEALVDRLRRAPRR